MSTFMRVQYQPNMSLPIVEKGKTHMQASVSEKKKLFIKAQNIYMQMNTHALQKNKKKNGLVTFGPNLPFFTTHDSGYSFSAALQKERGPYIRL